MLLSILQSKRVLQYDFGVGTGLAIGAGVSAISGAAQIASTGKLNKKNRRFQEEQAWKANQTNLENWERQNRYNEMSIQGDRRYLEERWGIENAYNSPQAQMERFKAAGLNPNLIYGQSSMGGTISPPESDGAAPMPAANKSDYRGQGAPPIDLLEGIMAINKFRADKAQTDLVREQIKTENSRRAIMAIEGWGKMLGNRKGQRELDLFNELFSTSVDGAKAGVGKTLADTKLANQTREQSAQRFPYQLKQDQQNNKLGEKAIENAGYDNTIKRFKSTLAEKGISPEDDMFNRLLQLLMDRMGFGPKVIMETPKN